MSKTLVVVESPAKAKTIKKYLGAGYEVMASKGHVKDLPKKMGIDVEDGFKEIAYVRSGSDGVPYGMTSVGTPFKLLPGRDTTFMVLTAYYNGSVWTMAPGNTMSARLYYRPRRATV